MSSESLLLGKLRYMNSPCSTESYDYPTLVVAIIAMLISIVSICIQYIKIARLSVRLVAFKTVENPDQIEISYFIGNTGNMEFFLDSVVMHRHNGEAGTETELEIHSVNIPSVIEQHKVNIVSIIISIQDYQIARTQNENMGISFNFLGPKGNGMTYYHEMLGAWEDSNHNGHFWKTIYLNNLKPESLPNRVMRF